MRRTPGSTPPCPASPCPPSGLRLPWAAALAPAVLLLLWAVGWAALFSPLAGALAAGVLLPAGSALVLVGVRERAVRKPLESR